MSSDGLLKHNSHQVRSQPNYNQFNKCKPLNKWYSRKDLFSNNSQLK